MSTWSGALSKPVQVCTGMESSSMAHGFEGEYSDCLPSFLNSFFSSCSCTLRNEIFKRAHALENKNIPVADHPEVYRLELPSSLLTSSAGKICFRKNCPAFSIL